MLDWTEAQLTWTNLTPRYQKQFATQTDDKQIIEGLSNLAMGPSETTGELLARINNLMVIIKESFVANNNKVPEPPTDALLLGHVGLLENTAKQRRGQQHVAVYQDAAFPSLLARGSEEGCGPAQSDHDEAG